MPSAGCASAERETPSQILTVNMHHLSLFKAKLQDRFRLASTVSCELLHLDIRCDAGTNKFSQIEVVVSEQHDYLLSL